MYIPGKIGGKIKLSILIFFLVSMSCWGQSKLKITNPAEIDKEIINKIPKQVPANINVKKDLDKLEQFIKTPFYEKGYLFPILKFNSVSNDSIFISVKQGKKYQFGKIKKVKEIDEDQKISLSEEWLNKSNLSSKSLMDKPLSGKEIPKITNKLLIELENNGYPFAVIKWIPLSFDSVKNSIDFQIEIDKKQFVIWDSLEIVGDTMVETKFIANYLQIKKGKPYSEAQARGIEKKLKELLYIQLNKKPMIQIFYSRARVILDLKVKQANRINGVLGLAPSSTFQDKLLLTGEAEIDFLNLFQKGIQLNAGYKSFLGQSSNIKMNAAYPFLFNSLLGAAINFNYMKVDTAYYILDYGLKLQYQITPTDAFKITYQESKSRLIDVSYYKQNNIKPPYLDFTTKWYGLGVQRYKLDYFFNPKKGYFIKTEIQAGQKKLLKNVTYPESFYAGLKENSLIYKFTADAGLFVPLNKLFIFHCSSKIGILNDPAPLENQLFRFGGLKTLRGFDEEQFFANLFIIPNVELRLLTGEGSNLQLFTTMAYYERRQNNLNRNGRPLGFGLAYNYLTNLGMFNISFGLGKEESTPVDFAKTKLHIGYLNRF